MIQTTHGKVIDAFMAVKRLCETPLNIKDAQKVADLLNLMQGEVDYHESEIKRLMDIYASSSKNGMYVFPSPEAQEQYEKEFSVINEKEVTINTDTVVIDYSKYGDSGIMITPNEIMMLKNFIHFYDSTISE